MAKDIGDTAQFDLALRHAGSLPKPVVAAYYEMDVRGMRAPRPDTEIALIGQNLPHSSHVEFGAAPPNRSGFERSVLSKLIRRF